MVNVDAPSSEHASVLGSVPPLPSHTVPSGFIWPAASGRDVLRRVPLDQAERRRPDQADIRPETSGGDWETVVFEAGLWCLKASPRRCYSDAEVAREALRVFARRKIALGPLLPKNTVLMLQADGKGSFWMWSIAPWLATLQSEIDYARSHENSHALADSLTAYAGAVVASLKDTVRHDLRLDIHPTSFARAGNQVYYVVDDLGSERVPDVALALLAPIEKLSADEPEVDAYLKHLTSGLRTELSESERHALELRSALERMNTSAPNVRSVRQRLLAEVA